MGEHMLIRAEEQRDWAAVHAVNVSAFETPDEANLVDLLREQARPLVSLIAEDNGAIVGHTMFSPVSLPGHPSLKIMGLAPMAVSPSISAKALGLHLYAPVSTSANNSASVPSLSWAILTTTLVSGFRRLRALALAANTKC